jgi:hypothetical protein
MSGWVVGVVLDGTVRRPKRYQLPKRSEDHRNQLGITFARLVSKRQLNGGWGSNGTTAATLHQGSNCEGEGPSSP